jgi:hypothetical protein
VGGAAADTGTDGNANVLRRRAVVGAEDEVVRVLDVGHVEADPVEVGHLPAQQVAYALELLVPVARAADYLFDFRQ